MKSLLNVSTEYSLMNSLITTKSLVEYLLNNNIKYAGICDDNLFGVMDFYDKLTKNNIKPIIGINLNLVSFNIYAYAKNYEGYKNLLKLASLQDRGTLTIEDTYKYDEDIIYVLPYAGVSYFKELKYKDLYIAYTSNNEEGNALILTDKVLFMPNIKAFNLSDSYYLNMLNAIDNNVSINDINKIDYSKNTIEYYKGNTLINDKTDEFVSKINLVIPKDKMYIPKYKDGVDSYKYLESLSLKGLTKRLKGNVTKEYKDRLAYELNIIKNMGFADYFLIVYDYVLYAKTHDVLVGPGRGSAVSSLVAYSIGIIDIDPIKYNLLFERFLNPDRVTMPDIDIDFEETRRDKVVEYVKERYGIDKVSNIIAYGTFKSKLAIRSVGKALGLNDKLVDNFTKLFDASISIKDNLNNKDIKYYVNTNKDLRKIVTEALRIEGLKRNYTMHAAGIVISSVALDDILPVHFNQDALVSGIDKDYLEELGVLKMDFLALTNLSIIRKTLDILSNKGINIDLSKIDIEDKNVYKLFSNGDTDGVFQFESSGMKRFLTELKPDSFKDLYGAIAMFRPGPMQNINTYINRKHGKEKIKYILPELEPILSETYGIMVYQEQVMQVLRLIGGFTFAEADNVRRGMSKKKKEIIEDAKLKFIEGGVSNGYDKNNLESIYNMILEFASYGFNKSHSVAYAYLGYQMAYLKTYYPESFTGALLTNNGLSIDKVKTYIAMGKKLGIKFLAPSVNLSIDTYKIGNKKIRMPLNSIKGLGIEASSSILQERENGLFEDIFDFVSRTIHKGVNRKTLEVLINAGALDEFKYNRSTLLYNLDDIINYSELSFGVNESFISRPSLKVIERNTEEERIKELEVMGMYITNHPSSAYTSNIVKSNNISKYYDKQIEMVLLIESINKIKTKKNEDMAFINCNDEEGAISLVVFPTNINLLNNLKNGSLIKAVGRVAKRNATYQLNVINISTIK